MNTAQLFDTDRRSKAPLVFIACLTVLVGAVLLASLVQKNFGTVIVSNITYLNLNGIPIRAKLLRPLNAAPTYPAPGVVYIHGYQNNRETSDAYCIELARRGIVVLEIDAIGRGNSGVPGRLEDPDFDPTYGGKSSLAYLRSLDFVDANRIGLMGHSLGAEMVYSMALNDQAVKALVISGFAYREDATTGLPRNMLMIFGKYDEFRRRMTSASDFEKEWMQSPQTRKVISADNPKFETTYGNFETGTARRVYMPRIAHLRQSHHKASVAEALDWMNAALQPTKENWIPSNRQIWPIKEWSTLVAMLSGWPRFYPWG